jgi:N-acyl-D-amino-acid deacylase
MIRKMTSLAAEHFRLNDRGVLKKGSFADVVVFDPAAVKEKTNYKEPHQLSEGVTTLVVNGALTIVNGKLTGGRNGRFLD